MKFNLVVTKSLLCFPDILMILTSMYVMLFTADFFSSLMALQIVGFFFKISCFFNLVGQFSKLVNEVKLL